MLTTADIHPVFVHGRTTKTRSPVFLQAGRLSMHFYPDMAFLRTIQLELADGTRQEVLRGCYVTVRDHDWNSFANETSQLQVYTREDGFSLTFQTLSRGVTGAGLLQWQGIVTASEDGTICYEMEGKVVEPFRRNRIGFCILHPPELAGQPCEIQEVASVAEGHGEVMENGADREEEVAKNGTSPVRWRQSRFPSSIAAYPPMKNLRAIRHDLAEGLQLEVLMEGDTFEMEDQRNWTDASFKTYCTPLELPFPVEVSVGEVIHQKVTLKIHGLQSTTSSLPAMVRQDAAAPLPAPHVLGSTSGATERAHGVRRLTLNSKKRFSIPAIGVAQSSSPRELSSQELERLKHLRLAHLRVDLRLGSEDWKNEFDRAVAVARQIGAELEVAIFVTDQADRELERLFEYLVQWETVGEMPVAAWLIFHDQEKSTCAKWIELARQWLAPLCPKSQIASGTDMYFAELNRQPPPTELLDAVCYSINPQVHTEDNQSLVETLPIQATTVENARNLCDGLPVRVTPVTFRPRFNPNATSEQPKPFPGTLPEQVDPRQLSLFGAAWTLGSLKHLASSGVESITYFETLGWRGVQESQGGSTANDAAREGFPSSPGSVFPLYHVLADVGEFAGGEVIDCTSSAPLEIEGLFLEHQGRQRLLLGNYVDQEQLVRIDCGREVSGAWLRLLTTDNGMEAIHAPEAFRVSNSTTWVSAKGETLQLTLPSHAIARLDFEDSL